MGLDDDEPFYSLQPCAYQTQGQDVREYLIFCAVGIHYYRGVGLGVYFSSTSIWTTLCHAFHISRPTFSKS